MSYTSESRLYLARALQPIHIGSGGYQVERIDNRIVRDEESIPVIPGTTFSGAFRSYLALETNKSCGGRNGCGEDTCPVCFLFGYSVGEDDQENHRSRKGMVSIFEGRLLFYPVHTMQGPVWITTFSRLNDYLDEIAISKKGKDDSTCPELEAIKGCIKNCQEKQLIFEQSLNVSTSNNEPGEDANSTDSKQENISIPLKSLQEGNYFISLKDIEPTQLDLGWLLFHSIPLNPSEKTDEIKSLIDQIKKLQMKKASLFKYLPFPQENNIKPKEKRFKIAIIKEDLFSLIVNDTLEKRTSVAIDPFTNTSEKGALYKYEAVPRESYFYFTVTFTNPAGYMSKIPVFLEGKDSLKKMEDLFKKTFSYVELLGLGGMTTRGFGRLEIQEVLQ